MTSQRIAFEWREGEEAFNSLQAHLPLGGMRRGFLTATERWLAVRLLHLFTLVFAGLFIVTGASLSPAQHIRAVAYAGVQATLTLEEEAWRSDNREQFNRLLDKRVDDRWQIEWRDIWRVDVKERQTLGAEILEVEPFGDFALASVLIALPSTEWWRSSPYRETRFYRRTEQGWLRSQPATEFWGILHTRETEHLRFEFYTRDAEVVESILTQMETVYLELHRILGIAPPEREGKLTFALTPDMASRSTLFDDRQELTSPLLSRIPASMSNAAYAAHMIAGRLIYLTLNSRAYSSNQAYLYHWETVFWALSGWLRAELLGQRSPWHQLAEDIFRAYLPDQPRLRLQDISDWLNGLEQDQTVIMRRYMVTESFIAYAVETYGRATLPTLFQGLGTYSSWSALIPGVFQASVDEFEAGWNRYIAERYRAESAAP